MVKQHHFKLLDKVVLGRAVITPPFRASSTLEKEARFVYINKGQSSLIAPVNRQDLSAGDSVIMKCEKFVNNWAKNEEGEAEAIIFHFFPDVLQYIYGDQLPEEFKFSGGTKRANPVEKIPKNETLDTFIKSLNFYFQKPELLTEEILKVKLRELLFLMTNIEGREQIRLILRELFQSREYQFQEIVNANLFQNLKLEELAFLSGLSLSSFKRKFREIFKTSPGQYIKSKRLEKAKDLLVKTDLRISEIAFSCGFEDQAYFSKSFAAVYSDSPSGYRNSV